MRTVRICNVPAIKRDVGRGGGPVPDAMRTTARLGGYVDRRRSGRELAGPAHAFLLREQRSQEAAGVGARVGCDLFGGAGGDDFAAAFAAFGAEVDDPVGGLDDVEVVLDDDDGVAFVAEAVQDVEQLSRRRKSASPVVGSSRM